MWTLALLGNVLLWTSNQSVLHVCVIVYNSQLVYCSFITCRVTVTGVGQHLATYFAEWQKANTIMSFSTYAGTVNTEQLNCIFLGGGVWHHNKLTRHWCRFNPSSFLVKLISQGVFIAPLQNVEVRLGSIDMGWPSRFSVLLLHVAAPLCGWVLVNWDCLRGCG